MLTTRIIPCLDVKDGRVVKGVKFQGLRDAGAPAELAHAYELQGADEIILLDVSATHEGRAHQIDTVKRVREKLSIPLTIGGGVRQPEDAGRLLDAGADKVSVNSAAVRDPDLLSRMAERFGSQCTVISIDGARVGDHWEVVVRGGREKTGLDAIEWVKRAVSLGAGEVLLTSWDRDGTRSGYDLDFLRAVSQAVRVPVIASGGANTPEHMVEAVEAGADAVLAASIFHDGDWTVDALKDVLANKGLRIRSAAKRENP
ncbi:MAG: imidazole glycerol phosphate synthase subunit HisF [Myxococcota bacterium]|jgi:imidazoleglycerol phosphate synthase cyclase subunit|nr:imidazole glycerol phosphate synthase subunit HisF [Myxococcota bacterium]